MNRSSKDARAHGDFKSQLKTSITLQQKTVSKQKTPYSSKKPEMEKIASVVSLDPKFRTLQ